MARVKYKYNPKTLSYEKVELTKGMIFRTFLTYAFAACIFAVFVMALAYNFFESPKERAQRRELEQMRFQYTVLNDRMDQVNTVLEDLQNRDDNIYRVIFEAEPKSAAERKAGYGGTDRYAKLDGYKYSSYVIDATRKLDQITSQMVVQSKSFDELIALAKNKEELMAAIPAIQPIKKDEGRLVSGYGMRFHPILKYRRMHWGIDFSAPTGTPIYATADGEVSFTGSKGTYGNCVMIKHGYGYETLYGHMNSYIVKRKQKVKRGEIIGYVGNTGLSRAPHVHYEILKDGKKINPVNYFYNDFTPAEFEKVLELASSDNQVLS